MVKLTGKDMNQLGHRPSWTPDRDRVTTAIASAGIGLWPRPQARRLASPRFRIGGDATSAAHVHPQTQPLNIGNRGLSGHKPLPQQLRMLAKPDPALATSISLVHPSPATSTLARAPFWQGFRRPRPRPTVWTWIWAQPTMANPSPTSSQKQVKISPDSEKYMHPYICNLLFVGRNQDISPLYLLRVDSADFSTFRTASNGCSRLY